MRNSRPGLVASSSSWIPVALLLTLILVTNGGCRVCQPSQSPSQLWPYYIRQQAESAYACRYGCYDGSNIPLNGQPKSDFHQGFIYGYVNGETARLNTPPGPCPPRGWGWIPRGELISHTPAYAAGYQDGLQSVPSLREGRE